MITAHGAASLQVLFGNGNGTFTPGPIYGGDHMYEVDTILTGDFDGDGNVDVAAVWPSGPDQDGPAGGGGTQFEVLSGDGTGNFALTYGFYGGGYYFLLTAADVNGDGISDLISPTMDLGDNLEPNLTVFYGTPNRAMQFVQIPTERCASGATPAQTRLPLRTSTATVFRTSRFLILPNAAYLMMPPGSPSYPAKGTMSSDPRLPFSAPHPSPPQFLLYVAIGTPKRIWSSPPQHRKTPRSSPY